ncbi:MAG: ABC transporter permease [Alphaproteobacteria bacterium]|nr:ABC transporter permease [Alphaproteobacteria bacterium]
MKRTLLIARQEFIKYVTRRGFFISILMFPLWVVVATVIPQWTGGSESPRILMIVDQTGGQYRDAIRDAIGRDNESRNLAALSHYAGGFANLGTLPPATAQMLRHPESETSRRAFEAAGGLDAVRAQVQRALKPNAPAFTVPPPRYIYAEPPRDLADRLTPDTIGGLLKRKDPDPFAADAVVVIPPGFGPDHPQAQFWSDTPRGNLRDFVNGALTDALRLASIRAVAPNISDRALLTDGAELETRNPAHTDGSSGALDQAVPIALAVILFVVSVMNSSVLLQGVVEEKSTRMIEVLLSCATPREITTGKLIGVIGVALTTLAIWGLALLVMMALASHEMVALVFASLRTVITLQSGPLLLLYFLCGLLIYGSLFLAIGSMANSLADAQSLLGPSMLILMLPNLMIAGVMRDPNGPLGTALSWVPIYTPFFMMLRIASHPPVWQLWGTAALALITTTLMILWTGRVFAKHVLTTERPPALSKLISNLFNRSSQ